MTGDVAHLPDPPEYKWDAFCVLVACGSTVALLVMRAPLWASIPWACLVLAYVATIGYTWALYGLLMRDLLLLAEQRAWVGAA